MKSKDEHLKQYLLSNNLVGEKELFAAELEIGVTGTDLGKTLVINGFLRQDEYVSILLEITDETLFEEELIVPAIPEDILIETKTKLIAETSTSLYLSTFSDEDLIENLLSPYFPDIEFSFMPADMDGIESYLDKLVGQGQGEIPILISLLNNAASSGCSDIHIEPRKYSYSVFLRYHGERTLYYEGNLEEYGYLVSRIKDKCNIDMSEVRIPLGGGFSYEFNGRIIDLRVATIPLGEFGEKITIRLLDPEKANLDITQLGITRLSEWMKGVSVGQGLCLLCGPTGSGKTTTLNATTGSLDKFGKCIYTVEDPVEYSLPYISQININEEVGLTFPKTLKSLVRQDPDVIIIGEIRDQETARYAVTSARTGHLVLATVHAGSMKDAVVRLGDLGLEPYEYKELLRSIMMQRLMRKLCGVCHGDGCSKCLNTGYESRTIVSEVIYFKSIKEVNMFMNSEEIYWETIQQDAYKKYLDGQTRFEELIWIFGEDAFELSDQYGFSDRDKARIQSGDLDLNNLRAIGNEAV